jgi:5-methylthioadenosine/S-adenosylhomocysteine deaminase
MKQFLIKPGAIVTMDGGRRVIKNGGILIRGNTIENVRDAGEMKGLRFEGEVIEASGLVAIPGFIQTHIHLCQTLFRGLADDFALLDWLKQRIFPFEAAHNEKSMYASAMAGIAELVRSGTTTIMDMGSLRHEEQIVRAIEEAGLRAFVGKAMMDVNELYPALKETTRDSLVTTRALAEQLHNTASGRIRYAVAPRFVLSCTDALLREAYEMTSAFPGMLFHTHAAENRLELEAVRKRCRMDNIEFFESIGILKANTCLAHCIWLNEREEELLHQREAKVLHCPSSNLKLGSGIARVPHLLRRGIAVSLGADGAPCNNTLDMFKEMRLAALIQRPVHGPKAMDAETVFAMATTEGARTLGMQTEIGSIEAGKKADIVLLDLEQSWNPYDEYAGIYSAIVYSGSPENVHSVMIDGTWIVRNGEQQRSDEENIVRSARKELRSLLQRIN